MGRAGKERTDPEVRRGIAGIVKTGEQGCLAPHGPSGAFRESWGKKISAYRFTAKISTAPATSTRQRYLEKAWG